ncbi:MULTISPECIES: hypothetical protein [Metabacillus]|uniref:DUF4912 domain-containing protein n=2 Tax=Metabacillus TaxID=2675233 RepID=A0A179SU78_9BACI|nr:MULTISPECIES: hypothetical protein [Metabacillus]OAS85071.1 hypothetical protein A6K24_06050 [Metabacillus litoralis]QNF26238.1 hypothetical protein HUW50_00935 [Metabacillus sp. KUDC1714]
MKPIENSKTTNIIRAQSTFCEDSLKIIAYPTCLLITWNILSTTKILLENILGEQFNDLHMRVILSKKSKQEQMTDFFISDPSGVLHLATIPTGIYNCELVVSNSHNETITVKRSNTIHFLQSKNHRCKEIQWEQLIDDPQMWLQAYSGYTVYE